MFSSYLRKKMWLNNNVGYMTSKWPGTWFTQKHRLSLIGFCRTQDLSVKQIPTEDDRQTGFVQRLHDDRPDSFIVGKQVERSEEEEENKRQPKEEEEQQRQHKLISQLIHIQTKTQTLYVPNKSYTGFSVTSGMSTKLTSSPARLTSVSC